jgi:microtubule-associated protein 1 light chain
MSSLDTAGIQGAYKQKKSFDARKAEVTTISSKFPNKIPVIVERGRNERNLPLLDRSKFLVPEELSLAQFSVIVRERLGVPLSEETTMFFLVNDKSLVVLSTPLRQVYENDKDEDGFLYMVYTSQPGMG